MMIQDLRFRAWTVAPLLALVSMGTIGLDVAFCDF